MRNRNRLIGILITGIILQVFLFYSYIAFLGVQISFIQVIILSAIGIVINGLIILTIYKSHAIDAERVNKLTSKYELTIILFNLLKGLSHEEDTHKIYESILKAAARAIPSCEFGSIILAKEGKMRFESSFGFNHDYLELVELDIENTALYKKTNGKMDHAIIVSDILSVNDANQDEENVRIFKKIGIDRIRSTITAPISVGNSVIGSINLDSSLADCFNEEDIETLEIFALEVGKFVQLHQMNELNRKMSRYDDLTKTYNRGYCKSEIKQLLAKGMPFSIVSIDLNRLKVINDAYGHDIGDVYLLTFVQITNIFIDKNVFFSRYGGDEFILIFPHADLVAIKVVLEDISNYLKMHPIEKNKELINVSFSYGIASFPEDTRTYDELLKIADGRMYESKNKYRESLLDKKDV